MTGLGLLKTKRSVIVKGICDKDDIFNVACSIAMITYNDKVNYISTGDETPLNVYGYKATHREQQILEEGLAKIYPRLDFIYLNKKGA